MFLDPEKILNQLELRSDMQAAEFGCGAGNFSFALAKRLDQGLVWAIDVLAEPLSALKGRQVLEKVVNIKIVRADLEKPRGSTMPDSSADLIVIPNVLFQAQDKTAIIEEAERVLKTRGVIVVIDWSLDTSQGPEKKVSPEEIKKIAEDLGLEFKKEIEAGKYHFALVFEK